MEAEGVVGRERDPERAVRGRRARSALTSGLYIPLPQDWRACILPVIGLATPMGLLTVNASAWVISQLGAFRSGVAVSAFISAIVLNGLTGLNLYRYVRQRWPAFLLSRPEHAVAVFWISFVLVVLTAVFAAVFSFIGMENPRQLPNGIAVVTALVGVALPLGVSWLLGRTRRVRPSPPGRSG